MLQTSARLLRVLTLLQTRSFWSGAELAERLEVTERTVRRDIDRLRNLGYPVDATSGVAGGYRLSAGATLPPLLLEDDEALAVALGLRSTAAGSVSGMEEASLRALTKLEQVLPARLKRRIKALHSTIVPLHMSGPAVELELLATLSAAVRDREVVCIGYEDSKGKESQRRIEPYGLVHSGVRWYLVAWDTARHDWRTFRVDRIRSPITTDGRFLPRALPERDLGAYVSNSIATKMYPHQARFILHAPLQEVAQRVSPLAARLEPLDDERCLLETGGHTLQMIPLYVASLGIDFEVLEPPELVDLVRQMTARLRRAVPRK